MDTRLSARRFGTVAIAGALLLLLIALVSGSLVHSKNVQGPSVVAAQIVLPAVPGRPAAGYLTVDGGVADDVLTGVSAPAPMRVEMHESMTMHGMSHMAALPRAEVPAGGQLTFAEGGKHLMIFGAPAGLKSGDTLPLTLRFAKAGAVPATAIVRSAGDGMAAN